MDETMLTQRTYTTVIKHFIETGRAPHYTELAAILDVLPEEGRLQKMGKDTPFWIPAI